MGHAVDAARISPLGFGSVPEMAREIAGSVASREAQSEEVFLCEPTSKLRVARDVTCPAPTREEDSTTLNFACVPCLSRLAFNQEPATAAQKIIRGAILVCACGGLLAEMGKASAAPREWTVPRGA